MRYNELTGVNCRASVMPLDVPEPKGPLIILGCTFMEVYYSVFDRDRNQVGFAKAIHNEEREIISE
jgi:hypothetical protein